MDLLSDAGFMDPMDLPVYRRVLLFGRPGCGKTSAMMTASKSIMMGTERGVASLAQAGTRHQGTGEALPTFKRPMSANEYEGAAGIVKLHDTLLRWYSAGAFNDPEGMLRGAKTLCIDGIDTIRRYVNEAYDKQTGREKEMRNENQMFNQKEIGFKELGKRSEPYSKILKIIEHANMNVIMSCTSRDYDFVNPERIRKNQAPIPDEPGAIPRVRYMCDIIIEILDPSRKEIPNNARDRHGWYKVWNKSRFGGNWRQGSVGQHFDFERMDAELRQLELAGDINSDGPAGPPSAKTTMDPVDTSGGENDRLEMILQNVRVAELAENLGLSREALVAGVTHKYNCDLSAVLDGLEAAWEKKQNPPPPEEEF